MDEAAVLLALLEAHLTDGLEEGLALDVAGGAADLGNDHIGLGGRGQIVDIALDLVGDVGDDLNGLAEVSALTLLIQHVPVDLAGGEVRILVQVLVDEALVMAQVQVGLGAVVGDEDLTVLQGAHGTRVHVHVGVQLLAATLRPRHFSSRPREAAVMPLPRPETTPPVTKINFAIMVLL